MSCSHLTRQRAAVDTGGRRYPQRAPRRVLAALLALALMRATAVFAAGVVGTGTPASCTEATLDAALADGGKITFNCGPSPVTITVTSTQTIAQDTAIDGGGRVTISGGNSVGVFSVSDGVKFTVQNLTIANGNSRAAFGGGILNDGTLTVINCTFSGNSAPNGGGISNRGTLTVTNSAFSGNSAGRGGGISNNGTLTVTNCTFSGNSAFAISGVSDGDGGGIYNFGTLTLTNCTLSGNSATGGGGGIWNRDTLTLTNCTLSGNSAAGTNHLSTGDGGGIFNAPGSLPGGGYSGPGRLTLSNTIVANSPLGGDCQGDASGDHNIIEDATKSCYLTNGVDGNILGVDPMLDSVGLKDNGGPTQTIALLAGSPADDAGDPEVCANSPVNGVDQRGYVRPGEGSTNCSIGAYEYNSLGVPTPTPTPTATPTATPTPTPKPSGGGGDGGCTVTPHDGGVAWWLLVPALVLAWARRRQTLCGGSM